MEAELPEVTLVVDDEGSENPGNDASATKALISGACP
jgi:hypothetical protein